MRTSLSRFVPVALLAVLIAGCAGPERKLGRGVTNSAELIRLSEFNRSVEQGGLFPDADNGGLMAGMVRGVDRTFARTGVGIFEVVTFPIPPYHAVLTNYLPIKPQWPDAYRPRKWSEPVFDTDHALGFSGGDIAPWFPGSRFRVFDN